jgi:thiol-disulfide isomerase/thioredoxin
MRTRWLASAAGLLAAVLMIGASLFAAEAPPTAESLLSEGQSKAAPGHKSVFLIFHASWCGWCHKLDQFMATPEIQPILDKYFVAVHVVVLEHGDKEYLDNPGGAEWMAKLGGKGSSIPFFAFLDSRGEAIVNSIRPGDGKSGAENIGYPNEPHEIDWFMTMLGKAAPQMPAAEAATIEQWLRKHSSH